MVFLAFNSTLYQFCTISSLVNTYLLLLFLCLNQIAHAGLEIINNAPETEAGIISQPIVLKVTDLLGRPKSQEQVFIIKKGDFQGVEFFPNFASLITDDKGEINLKFQGPHPRDFKKELSFSLEFKLDNVVLQKLSGIKSSSHTIVAPKKFEGEFSLEEAGFNAHPLELYADGKSEVSLSLQIMRKGEILKEARNLDVQFITTGGTLLNGVNDSLDGTYKQKLMAPVKPSMAKVYALINGKKTKEIEIKFKAIIDLDKTYVDFQKTLDGITSGKIFLFDNNGECVNDLNLVDKNDLKVELFEYGKDPNAKTDFQFDQDNMTFKYSTLDAPTDHEINIYIEKISNNKVKANLDKYYNPELDFEKVELIFDREPIVSDGFDRSYYEILLKDRKGIPVKEKSYRVVNTKISQGDGSIVHGLDIMNNDHPFKGYVKAGRTLGKIKVNVFLKERELTSKEIEVVTARPVIGYEPNYKDLQGRPEQEEFKGHTANYVFKDTGRVERYVFTKPYEGKLRREVILSQRGHATSGLGLHIVNAQSVSSGLKNPTTSLQFFPRTELFTVNKKADNTKVRLPTGEEVEFDQDFNLKSSPILSIESKTTDTYPEVKYTGKGVVIKKRAYTGSYGLSFGDVEIYHPDHATPCKVPASSLYKVVNKSDENTTFIFDKDEDFNKFLIQHCKFSIPGLN
jgi:hypothetical protein